MVTIAIGIGLIISIFLNIETIKACVIAQVPDAVWKELFKMALNVGILIYLYSTVNI